MTYTHNAIFAKMSTINAVAWSLEIEVQFYILLPLLSAVLRIRNNSLRRFWIIAIAASSYPATWLLYHAGFHAVQMSIVHYLPFFLTGILVADIQVAEKQTEKSYVWDLFVISAWILLFMSAIPNVPVLTIQPLMLLIICLGAFKATCWSRILKNRWIVTIGGMCYTIYLYHYLVIDYLYRWTCTISSNLGYHIGLCIQGLLIGMPILVVSSILFILFEKPFMYRDWPSRIAKKFC